MYIKPVNYRCLLLQLTICYVFQTTPLLLKRPLVAKVAFDRTVDSKNCLNPPCSPGLGPV